MICQNHEEMSTRQSQVTLGIQSTGTALAVVLGIITRTFKVTPEP